MSAENKDHITWERSIEIFKVLATLWVAGVGTIVTMQFNERQHELNRIEAIAKMLPHLSVKADQQNSKNPGASRNPDMSRDGAIWAIYRTANNKTMLRDLASLFPEDIYRVVSSTAQGGGLSQDHDAMAALEVASEKLAAKFTSEKKTELALRLYDQAVRLRQRSAGDPTPIHIVDITDAEVQGQPAADETGALISSVNKLGELHWKDSEKSKGVNTHHFQAKQLYKRARDIGKGSSDKDVKSQVAIADTHLGKIYAAEHHFERAQEYLKEAKALLTETSGADSAAVKETDRLLSEVAQKIEQNGTKINLTEH
ncbi:MAG TPA: hypothetical protein V6D17_05255 [Candidatus Obscuribacterales bacterium]